MSRKKGIVTVFFLVLMLSITGCGESTATKALVEGKKALSSREYDKALGFFEMAIKEGGKETEAKKITRIIKDYQKSLKLFEDEEIEEAKKIIDKIDKDYKKYSIRKDIDKLKDKITSKIKEEKELEKEIKKIEELISAKSYTEAKLKIEELLNSKKVINKNQREQLDIDLKKVEEEIEKEKTTKEETLKEEKNVEENQPYISEQEGKEIVERAISANDPNYLETHEVIRLRELDREIDGDLCYGYDVRSYIGGAANSYFVNSSTGELIDYSSLY